MPQTTAVPASHDPEFGRDRRRPLAVLSVVGYPAAVLVLTQVPSAGVPPAAAAAAAALIMLPTLFAMWRLYEFRGHMAQAPDHELDERQVRVRDRAYLESYRLFVLFVLLALFGVGVLPGLVGRPVTFDYMTIQWFIMGVVLLSLTLPSAVVGWQEPDLPVEA